MVNAIMGEPLKKVHLALRLLGALNGVPYSTMTDNAAGHFLIDDIDPGRNFAASRNGRILDRD